MDTDGETVRTERLWARGHEHVSATHESTLEVTTDDWLTPAGDCILAVEADRTPADFDAAFVTACQAPTATVTATLRVYADADADAAPGDGDARDDRDPTHEAVVEGRGHPDLTFDGDRSAVVRTSEYVDDRTVVVGADAAAADLDRELVRALADGALCEFVLRVR
jgi:hypothetical protein